MKRARGAYEAKLYTPDEKKVIARFCHAFREENMKWDEVMAWCKKAGYAVDRATLMRWVARIEEGKTPVSLEKGSGRRRSMEDEHVAVIIGWFLQQEDDGKKTAQLDFLFIASNNFGVCLSQPTVSRLLKENWLTRKLFGRRSVDSSVSREETSRRYYEELLKLDRSGIWEYQDSHIWCMDVTTNSHRYELPKSWGGVGRPQRKILDRLPVHMDSLVTLVSAEGLQRGPFVFSHNKEFKRGSPQWPAIVKYCEQIHYNPNEIVYAEDGNKKYYKEDCYMMEHVLGKTKPWEGHVFLTDKGTAFRPGGESIILDNEADHHHIFDPPIHGKMSINDGHIHPYAKAQWVSMRKLDDPEWKQTLDLVYCISTVPVASTKRAWDRLFFRDRAKSLKAVDNMLWGNAKGSAKERQAHHDHCLKMYQNFVAAGGVINANRPTEVPADLQSKLDGAYWEDD